MRKPIKIESFSKIVPFGSNFPIDQYPIKPFNLNGSGFPMSDIDAFEKAQSDAVKATILKRLDKIGRANFDNRPTSEIIETIMPNGCQSPAEVARYSTRLARHYQDKIDAVAAQKAADAQKAAAAAAARQRQEDLLFEKRFKESFIKMSESKK